MNRNRMLWTALIELIGLFTACSVVWAGGPPAQPGYTINEYPTDARYLTARQVDPARSEVLYTGAMTDATGWHGASFRLNWATGTSELIGDETVSLSYVALVGNQVAVNNWATKVPYLYDPQTQTKTPLLDRSTWAVISAVAPRDGLIIATYRNNQFHYLLWRAGSTHVLTGLGPDDEVWAAAEDRDGNLILAGRCFPRPAVEQVFVWQNGVKTLPDQPITNYVGNVALDPDGHYVCGTMQDAKLIPRGVIGSISGPLHIVDPEDSRQGSLVSVNSSGQAVGTRSSERWSTAMIYQDGQFKPIEGLSSPSQAAFIDDEGAVYGFNAQPQTDREAIFIAQPPQPQRPPETGSFGLGENGLVHIATAPNWWGLVALTPYSIVSVEVPVQINGPNNALKPILRFDDTGDGYYHMLKGELSGNRFSPVQGADSFLTTENCRLQLIASSLSLFDGTTVGQPQNTQVDPTIWISQWPALKSGTAGWAEYDFMVIPNSKG